MKTLLLLPFLLLANIANAQSNPFIATETLSDSQARLAAIPDKTAEQQFALGTVHFLRGIEKTMQLRWQHNANFNDVDFPVLRLPVAPNPNAAPFRPDLITEIFTNLLDDMAASRGALDAIDGDVTLQINLLDLWFDVNMNGMRDKGEGILQVSNRMPANQANDSDNQPTIKVQFDTADVAWLTAYTHLLSGLSEMVIAFDPTEAIATVLQTKTKMDALRGTSMTQPGFLGSNQTRWVDLFAMTYGALNMQPDAANIRAAHGHFLDMIAANKVFWAELALETDNMLEWIPNETQQAALGFDLPAGTGVAWQAVLADAEAILNGELLIPHWRISPDAGINVNAMFMDPPAVDIVTWIQGSGLLPYMERGPVAAGESIRAFEQLLSGRAFGFSLLLN